MWKFYVATESVAQFVDPIVVTLFFLFRYQRGGRGGSCFSHLKMSSYWRLTSLLMISAGRNSSWSVLQSS
jgi:hypothetical protein